MTACRLVALIAAGAACQERAQEVRSEAELKQTVDQMMPAVGRAPGPKVPRHPLLLRPPPPQVRDYVIHKFDNDLPPAELAGAQAAYRLFGLIPDTLDLRRTMVDLLTEQMKIFAQAPLWLRESLLFPYLGGAEFVRWFEREHPGEQPYGRRMPVSTEQILHPSRYAKGDAPTELAFARPPSDTVRYEDDLGEFETRLLLTQFLGDETEAGLLASGWGGDRYQVLGRAADVLVWYTVWDDRVVADRFAKGLERAWGKRRSGGATGPQRLPDGRPEGLPGGRPKGLPYRRPRAGNKRAGGVGR